MVTAPQSVPDNDLQLDQVIDLNRPDGMAPSGVFGAVTLPAGRILMSYTYLQNSFDNNFVGTHQVSTASVLAQFRYAPTRSLQDSQVATIAYAVTDDLTITGSLPFQHNEIDYTQLSGSNLRTDFTNPGDIRLSASSTCSAHRTRAVAREFGRQFPGGSAGNAHRHAVAGHSEPAVSIADQFRHLRPDSRPDLSRPERPLVVGHASQRHDSPGFQHAGLQAGRPGGSRPAGCRAAGPSGSAPRLAFDSSIWGNIGGQDGRLNTTLAPTNGTVYQAGRRINLLCGLNYYLPATRVPGQYFSVEGGLPAYQSLAGPQLGLNWILNASWTMVW